MTEPFYYPHLEIQIAEHCNLNCASCTHFSPLAEPSFVDAEHFYQQLLKANQIFEGHCKSLKIMGGEPLLHPELDRLLYLARKAMPSIKLTLQTNGILLTKLPEVFWKACHDNDIFIRVTRYPVKLDVEKIKALAEKYDARLDFHPSDGIEKSFNLYPLDVEGTGDAGENYSQCKMSRRYVLIKDDKLFPCPIAGNAEHFNAYFGANMDCNRQNYVPLNEINSFEDFQTFAEEAIAFCRHCKPQEYRKNVGWSVSQKKRSEWT